MITEGGQSGDGLIKIFSRLGVPRTIRTYASSTFKSELLTCFEQV